MFFINTTINIFERIEVLNTALQNPKLSSCEAYKKVEAVFLYLSSTKDDRFEEVWNLTMKDKETFDLEAPKMPRVRKTPAKLGVTFQRQYSKQLGNISKTFS